MLCKVSWYIWLGTSKARYLCFCYLTFADRYHYHFNPRTQQLGQLLQLAIGIAIDLGINQKPKKPLIDISGRSLAGTPPPRKQREAQRAYLGCYYLSTA